MEGHNMELSDLRKQEHLSASSIGTYIDCSLQYYFSRVKRLPMEFVSDALSFGTVIHLVLAEFYRSKMTGDRMSLKDIHESYRQHWKQEAEDRTDIQYADGKDFKTYLAEGVNLLSAWFNKLPDDNFEVIGVEEAFAFEVPGLPVPIIGAMDLVEQDDAGTVIITDFKTSSRAYSADEIDQNMQMTLYQLAARTNGFADREILLKLDCLIKTKTAKCESYWTTRSEIEEKRLIRKIQRVWQGISKGVFIPNDTSWKSKGCAFKKACNEWFLTGGD
jgi:putative RecB family exonuclease